MGNFKSNNNNDDNKNKIKKDYFSIINRILLEKNRTNSTLINNVKVALNEKNFDQISNTPIQYFTYAPNQEPEGFIYWLDFLYDYLCQEHSIDRYWALQMKEKLDEEKFFSENKYLSQFFLEEFEIENEPKCIHIQMNQIKSGRKKINLNSSTLNVTQNLGGSFSNSFIKGDENDDLATLKYKEFRNKVKRYILKFKEHILNKDHPINRVVQIFETIWVEYVSSKIYSIKQKYEDYNSKVFLKEINIIVNEMTEQLQRFVVHLQICLKLFYARTINFSCFNEEKDELINLLTTLVFRTGKISDIIFELYKLSLNPEIDNMREKFNKLIKITPEELGIFKQFCLNLETLNYQEKILMDYSKGNKINNKDIKKINSPNSINTNLKIEENNNSIDGHRDIDVVLALVRDNKQRCPKFGDREIDETKVKLEYEENFNMIPREHNIKKKNFDTLLPINEVSIDNGDERKSIQETNKCNIDDSNYNNESESNLNLFENDDFNKNLIIRSVTNLNIREEKSILPTKLEKVFNRVSFVRTKNIEYLSYPYETAIQLLKQIQKYKTPFEKMMIIASISSEITDCINDFWRDLNNYIKNDLLNLEIDQLMIIFIYIIIKSQIYDISVHCKIIKSFTTCITKASMIGYYYSTVEASVSYLQSIHNIKDLLKNKSK